MNSPTDALDEETASNLDSIPAEFYSSWGRDGVWDPDAGSYQEKTVVRSGSDAMDAFERYTEYFNHVLDSWSPNSDELVLVPCGSSKPIGSSTIHQKKITAIREGGLSNADVVVLSEPCTVVPPEYRLSVPAANYDFPPEYTVKEDHPEVFNIFADRLAEWLDQMNYDTVYPYLISGHQNKFDAALERMDTSPDVHNIPSASFNGDTGSYSGDRFKKQEDLTRKVKAVCKYKAGEESLSLEEDYGKFYQDRF